MRVCGGKDLRGSPALQPISVAEKATSATTTSSCVAAVCVGCPSDLVPLLRLTEKALHEEHDSNDLALHLHICDLVNDSENG